MIIQSNLIYGSSYSVLNSTKINPSKEVKDNPMVEIVFCILSFRWYLAMRNIFRHGQSLFSQKTLYRIRHSAFAKQNIYV